MVDDKAIRPERKPPIPHSKYKASPAARAKKAFIQLCKVLEKEWPTLRCLNLGVKSGTGVIDDVLLSQCHQLASTVHMLSVLDPDASKEVVRYACRLTQQHFQNLQVLLDTLGLADLSDFLRLMCCSLKTHRPVASSSSQAAGNRPSSSATTGAASHGRLASAGILKSAGSAQADAAGSSSTGRGLASRQRRMRAAAGVFELAQAGFADLPGGLQQEDDDEQQQQQHAGLYGGSTSPEPSPLGLKFASLLPPGHILVKTAEALKQQQEFQAALAHVTPRPAKQRTGVPPLHLPQQQEQQQGITLPAIHLAGYSHYHPNDLLGPSVPGGTWQQQQQQCGTPPSTAGGCSSSGRSPAAHHAATGPWRGSLLEGGGALPHQPPGAFFLSSWGGQLDGHGHRQLHNSAGQFRQHHQQQQQLRQQFRAPAVSIEQLWKMGRAATTAAVLEAAHLSVHESAGDALSLLLVPGLVVQRRVQPEQRSQLSTPDSAAGAGGALVTSRSAKLASRRASIASRRSSTANNNSSGSRPNSARGRPSSAVPFLPLHRVEAERGGGAGGGEGGVNSCGSSRPESGAGTSRLGHGCAAIDENKTFVTSTAVCME